MGDRRCCGRAEAHVPPLPGIADAQTADQPTALRQVRPKPLVPTF
jgi:hypothetical protein